MSSTPLSDDLGRRAGFPWYYPVVFLLNLALITALEVLLLYRVQLPLTDETLAAKNPSYSNSIIRNSTDSASVSWYLVESGDHTLHLVPLRKHILLQNRGRLLTDQIAVIPAETAHMEITTRAGIGGSSVMIGREVEAWADEQSEYPLQMRSKYSRTYLGSNGVGAVAGKYFFLALALSLLEYFLWHKIKGNI